jgi:hypothetical protein
MSPTRATYVLGALVLLWLAVMYTRSFIMGANPVPMALTIIVLFFTAIGAVHALRTSLPLQRPRVIEVAAAFAGAAATLWLVREMALPPLVGAAFIAVCFGVAALPDGPLDAMSAGAGYSGVCVGLLTPSITLGWYWVAIAGALAGFLWTLVGPAVMQGMGGRMGVVAFMASTAIYWTADLLGDEHNAVLLPGVDGIAHWAVVPIGAVGALITWLLMTRRGWGFNLASGVPSLIVCGVLALAGPPSVQLVFATAFFGGTFVGGTTEARLPTAGLLGAAGLMYGAYMLHFEGPLQGHVGVIGATGTISVLAVAGVVAAWRHLGRSTVGMGMRPEAGS